MVRHYSDTKLFNVSNYEKVYLREKKLQKISIRVKKEVPQRCCSIEDTVAITSQQTKQRRAPAKPMHTEKDTVDVRKSQDKERAGRL